MDPDQAEEARMIITEIAAERKALTIDQRLQIAEIKASLAIADQLSRIASSLEEAGA